MYTLSQFKKDYKRDVLVRIIQGLKFGTLTRDESRLFSKQILAAYNLSDEKILITLSKLSQVGDEYLDVYLKYAREYEKARDGELIASAREELISKQTNDYHELHSWH